MGHINISRTHTQTTICFLARLRYILSEREYHDGFFFRDDERDVFSHFFCFYEEIFDDDDDGSIIGHFPQNNEGICFFFFFFEEEEEGAKATGLGNRLHFFVVSRDSFTSECVRVDVKARRVLRRRGCSLGNRRQWRLANRGSGEASERGVRRSSPGGDAVRGARV